MAREFKTPIDRPASAGPETIRIAMRYRFLIYQTDSIFQVDCVFSDHKGRKAFELDLDNSLYIKLLESEQILFPP